MSEYYQKAIAIAVSLLTVVLLLVPIRHNWSAKPIDDFPLSYYPMFTAKRDATTVVHHAVGVTETGKQINIPGHYAGKGGMNAVRRQMRKMYRDQRADALAKLVAARLTGSRFAEKHQIVRVEIVKSKYEITPYFDGQTEPTSRKIAAAVNLEERAPQ